MGLDIYLKKYDDFNLTQELEKKHNEFSNVTWGSAGEYDSLSETTKDEINKKIKEYAESLGLDKYGSDDKHVHRIEEDSKIDPEHLFKIGYFRSSYNEGGIQRILRNLNLPDLSDVFEYDESKGYAFQPNWNRSLVEINDLIEKFKSSAPYRAKAVSCNIFKKENEINSEMDAIKAFMEEVNREHKSDYNYSNSVGEFSYHEPLKVLGLIPGKHNLFGERDCVYVITQSDNTWYLHALQIIKETIDFILSQDDKEKYYLHWSG